VTKAEENGHEICDMECEKHIQGRFTEDSGRRYIKIKITFSGSTGGGSEPAGKYTITYRGT
jgi:hypothetical protein